MRIAFVYCHPEPLSSTRVVHVAPSRPQPPATHSRNAAARSCQTSTGSRGSGASVTSSRPLAWRRKRATGVEPSDELAVEAE